MAGFRCTRYRNNIHMVSWMGKDRGLGSRTLARALGLPDKTDLPKLFRVGVVTADGQGHQIARVARNELGQYTVVPLRRGRVVGEPKEIYAKSSGVDGKLIMRTSYARVGEVTVR